MAGSVLTWAPPGRGRRVPGPRNGLFWQPKNPGTCFWGRKKSPAGSTRTLTWFWARTGLEPGLSRENRLFTLHSQHHSLPQETLTYDILPNLKCLSQGSNLPLQSSGEIPIISPRSPCSPRRGSNPVPPGCVVRVPTHWAI